MKEFIISEKFHIYMVISFFLLAALLWILPTFLRILDKFADRKKESDNSAKKREIDNKLND